jgi:anaerobic selenocysteine-containing dehydrogenase
LRREPDGTFTEIDWDTAISEIATKLAAVRDTYGGETIFFYGGGGQGNHLGGAYRGPLQHVLGARYKSNPLAQEKCGEAWVDAHLTGSHTHGDFEHAEVSVFIGKNPWHSHGVTRARTVLKDIAKDPDRTMVVIDPVRSETADMADFHLQVRPGTDAWCLAALLGVIAQEDLLDQQFAREHLSNLEPVLTELSEVDVAEYAGTCGIPEETLRLVARRIARAESVSTYEDLGVQQGPNSTLISYLNKLIWLLTGNFGKPGAMQPHSWFAPLVRYDVDVQRTPVTDSPMPAGLVPANVIASEILTDHPARFRAMMIDSSNPAHSLADTTQFREALEALELVVVIDVALTETGRLADYVLPASSQYEKWEATFFNFEFPHNTFHLRAPVLSPLPGTLPESEIYCRLVEQLVPVPKVKLALLGRAARLGRTAYLAAFAALLAVDKKNTLGMGPYLLYKTLGPTLPDGAEAAAVLWALALRTSREHRNAMRRAGHSNASALFQAALDSRSGVTFTADRPEDAWSYVRHSPGPIPVTIPDLLADLRALPETPAVYTTAEFPFVLVAGQRRAFTANTIFRDDSWRQRDKEGTLRLNPEDARRLDLADESQARVTTARGSAVSIVEVDDRLQPGHAALPNGFGLDLDDGDPVKRVGVALNTLTDSSRRDAFSATPWHKNVPARIEPMP